MVTAWRKKLCIAAVLDGNLGEIVIEILDISTEEIDVVDTASALNKLLYKIIRDGKLLYMEKDFDYNLWVNMNI